MLVNLIYLTILGILVIGECLQIEKWRKLTLSSNLFTFSTKFFARKWSKNNLVLCDIWFMAENHCPKKRRISKIADVNKFNNAWNIPELGDEPAQRTISGQNDDEQQMYLAGGFDSSAPAKMKATEDELRKLDLETLEDLILKLHGQH
uniref:Uncharacterized protein n=1 Tax=Romanomermis culicivorax TaxID=13658 RepID=A0A915L984_ROMCU